MEFIMRWFCHSIFQFLRDNRFMYARKRLVRTYQKRRTRKRHGWTIPVRYVFLISSDGRRREEVFSLWEHCFTLSFQHSFAFILSNPISLFFSVLISKFELYLHVHRRTKFKIVPFFTSWYFIFCLFSFGPGILKTRRPNCYYKIS